MIKSNFKKNITTSILSQVLKIIIAFINTIFLARLLGTEGRGEYSYLILISGIVVNYGHLGINFINAIYMKKKEFDSGLVYWTNALFVGGIVLFIVFNLILARLFGIFLSGYSLSIVMLLVILIIFQAMSYFFSTYYVFNEKIYIYNKYINKITIIEFIGLAILAITGNFTLINLLFIKSSLSILLCVKLKKDILIKGKINFSTKLLKFEFKDCLLAYFAALFIFLNYRIDQFMIEGMIGVEGLGVYSICVTIAELVFLIPNAIGTSFMSKILNSETKDNFNKVISISSYVTLGVVIIVGAGAGMISIIYGKDFIGTEKIIRLMLVGVLFASLGKIISNIYIANGKMKIQFYLASLTFIINLFLNIILIPQQGVKGAAMASTISYVIYGGTYLIVYIINYKTNVKSILSTPWIIMSDYVRRKK